ncbi:hypothetical protein R3I94_016112 [Phoxinus phoxinus]|uniref:Thyroglobulin type-1 domain-containing protein n=1 Tax=Phoxinus phoxinus TaxID=58324 RepID=A0AAN9CQU2_9TELE
MSTDSTDAPLLRTQSEQTSINMGPQGGSNSRALKVAGVTLLAAILIAGQAFTAYTMYSHREQLNTLERRNDRLHELSRKFVMRSQGVPMKMQLPMSSLALTLDDSPKEKDSSSPKPEPSVLSQCLKEAAGVVKSPLPSFRPRCDENGDYQLQQCWDETNWCWCVDKSGVQTPGSLNNGTVQCPADAKVTEPLLGKDGH